MLGGLQRHGDAGLGRQLTTPQAGGEHDLLALDGAALGADPDDPAVRRRRSRSPRCPRRSARPAVVAPLAIDIVTSTGLARPSSGVQKPWMMSSICISGTMSGISLRRRASPWSCRPSACRPSRGDRPRRAARSWRAGGSRTVREAGRQAGLRLEPGVEVARVPRHPQRVLGGAAGDHLAGRVPGGARRQLLALEEDHVGRAQEWRGGRRSTCRSRPRRRRRTARGRAGRRVGVSAALAERRGVDGGEVERHGCSLPRFERLFNHLQVDEGGRPGQPR